MKEQLVKALEKGLSKTSSMTLLNPFPDKNTVPSVDKMYEIVIESYESQQKEVMFENASLRQLLLDFYRIVQPEGQVL